MFYTAVASSGLLNHLQTLFSRNHSLDVLALQKKMQQYHLDMEDIPDYINALKYNQKQPKRSGNPITAAILLLIVTNVMLSTERFPCYDELWEDPSKDKRDWAEWKNKYKAADQNSKFTKQAIG